MRESVRKDETGYLIRTVRPADLVQICSIEQDTFTQPWSENAFLSALESRDYYYLCAEDRTDKQILGYCSLLRSFETADITNMAVARESRNLGVGRALLSSLMKEGFAQGIERFTLEVRVSNAAAIHLYESLGFRTEGVRKNFYALPVEDALIMWTPDPNEPVAVEKQG